jgi:hypothetical protein
MKVRALNFSRNAILFFSLFHVIVKRKWGWGNQVLLLASLIICFLPRYPWGFLSQLVGVPRLVLVMPCSICSRSITALKGYNYYLTRIKSLVRVRRIVDIFLMHWILVITTVYYVRLDLPNGLFPFGFPTKIQHQSFVYPCVLHALPITSSITR